MHVRFLAAARLVATAALVVAMASPCQAEPLPATPAKTLKLAIVQVAVAPTLEANRSRIVSGVAEAASRGARVVVFPEGALRSGEDEIRADVEGATAAIAAAARENQVYVVYGGWTYSKQLRKNANWMRAVDPSGRQISYYEKLFENHRAAMPGVFRLDGVGAGAVICADRWLRGATELPIQQGAQISFELSNNFACEWVPELGWYWYVPRALNNNVCVVFANSASNAGRPGHGHSAIIAPDGHVVAAAEDASETIVMAEIDVRRATRAEAEARAAHSAMRPFWEAGVGLHAGESVEAPPPPSRPLGAKETEVTLAAAQVAGNVERMASLIREAKLQGADLIAFPARAIETGTGSEQTPAGLAVPASGEVPVPVLSAVEKLQAAARENQITVVVGTEHRVERKSRNAAFVLGPDGAVLTRYDQLSAESPCEAGKDPAAMWFEIKGLPAVVTLERDARWTELAELAAVAGARIHVHLDCDSTTGDEANLRRLQTWCNLASYQTFTVTANVCGSAIWEDLHARDESRAVVRGLPAPETGPLEVCSPFSANLIVRAAGDQPLIMARRRVPGINSYHPQRTAQLNPQMEPWYRIGAAIVRPQSAPPE